MVKCRVLYKWNLFRFGQILLNLACTFSAHHEKSFVPESFKVSIDHVFDYIESGKGKYCFGKKSGNGLEFWIPNLYKPCTSKNGQTFQGCVFLGESKNGFVISYGFFVNKKRKVRKGSFTMTTACPHAPRNEKKRGKNNKLILVMKTRRKSNKHKLCMNIRNAYISA